MARSVKRAGASGTTRGERARSTRRRICAAAQRLFVESGYGGTTMEDVAVEAGVAVQTVYFVFHTKAQLLRATFDAAVLGDLDAPPPHQQEWYKRALNDPDPGRSIELFVRGNAAIHSRVGPLVPVLLSSGVVEVRALFDDRERLRWEGFHVFSKSLQRRGALKLPAREATDLLYALAGPQLHAVLSERGWGPRKWERWLTATLREQLLK